MFKQYKPILWNAAINKSGRISWQNSAQSPGPAGNRKARPLSQIYTLVRSQQAPEPTLRDVVSRWNAKPHQRNTSYPSWWKRFPMHQEPTNQYSTKFQATRWCHFYMCTVTISNNVLKPHFPLVNVVNFGVFFPFLCFIPHAASRIVAYSSIQEQEFYK